MRLTRVISRTWQNISLIDGRCLEDDIIRAEYKQLNGDAMVESNVRYIYTMLFNYELQARLVRFLDMSGSD